MSDAGLYVEFFERVGDAGKAELAELDAPTLLRLLALTDREDVARFGRAMAIPVGRKTLNVRDAERLGSSMRAHDYDTRMHAADWLTRPLRHQLMHALLGSAGWDDACGSPGYLTLTEMLEEWPATVLRLTVIGSYRAPELADRLLAAAIVDGTLVAAGWRDAADEFAEEAAELVEEFLDAVGSHDDGDDGHDGGEGDACGELGGDGAPVEGHGPREDGGPRADVAPAGDAAPEGGPATGSGDPEPDRPAVPAAGGDGGDDQGRTVTSDAGLEDDGAVPHRDAGADRSALGSPPTGPGGATTGAPDDAGGALRRLAAAILAARAALADRQGGQFDRLETLGAPAGAPALAEAVTEQVGAVRALAASAGGDAPEAAFLAGLIALLGLGDLSDRMAAGMELLADPVGRDFAPLLMAAGTGSVTLDAVDAGPEPLAAWVELLDGEAFDAVVAAWGDGENLPFDDAGGPGTGGRSEEPAASGDGSSPKADANASTGGSDDAVRVTDDGAPIERPDNDTSTTDGQDATATSAPERPDDACRAGGPETGVMSPQAAERADPPETPAQPALDPERLRGDGASQADGDGTGAPVAAAEAPPAAAVDETNQVSAPAVEAPTWASLFAAGRWSLASWLALAQGDTGRAAALEAIAVIDIIRSGTGLASGALFDLAGALEPAAIGRDEPVQLLALAAAMRASLIAPFAGTVGPLGYLGSIFAGRCPSLAALAAAARAAAESGLPLADRVAAPVDESARARAAADAGEWLARPRHTNFERADRIWTALVGRDGLIGKLLRPVAADAVGKVDAVRSAIAAISPARIDAELRHQDNLVRHGGSKRLQGGARNTLQRWCDEAIRLASTWVLAAEAADAAKPGLADGRHQADLAALRRAADAERAGALAELNRLADGDDVELGGAASGARLLLDATLALIDGTPLPGPEMAPELAGRVDLLRTRLALDANGRPARLADLTAGVADDVAPDWVEAFARRCSVYDFVGSTEVVALVRVDDPGAAETLEAAQASAIAGARAELTARSERLQVALDAGRRNGIIDETYAAAIGAYLLAADPERSDLGAVRDELDTAEATLAEAETAATMAFAERLAEVRASHPDIAEAVLAAAATLAGQGDLATAEETLIQGLDGAEPVTEHRSDIDFAEFFPAVVADMAGGIEAEVVKAAANRARFGASLDFSGLSAEAATSTARALSRWRDVATGTKRVDLRADLAPALRLLGIGAGGDRPAPNLPRSAERAWVDLTGVDRTGQRLVPAFGSAAGTDQRLLLVWRQPPPETLLSYLEQDPSDRSVIVCYFGTMPAEARRDLARRLRRLPAAKAVVVVDDAVVAWASAMGLGSFEVTMRATLPFSAVNPYLTGHRGAIPEEMFYGRVAERQEVMAEAGTSLIYGGRRLGKSALLHEAGRRFEETPGQLAVYVDLDPASIRATRRADALWDLVAPKLAEKGVVAPRPGRRRVSNYEAVEQAVRIWLEEHPGGRLLLALDECDAFFDADGANNFPVTRSLKAMMERDGRFKVVFAGLHQVQRFATIQNTPFAHLGRSVPIGPLAPTYGYSLLAKPLRALGWDLSPELASRVLAYTNYLPILLQEVGHALVELLQSRPCDGPMPAKVTADDINEVLSSEALADAIHERFTLTLNLDPRYTVISYVVAIEALEEGMERTVSVRELRSRSGYYWPAGFADVREDEFRALLEELVGLGILARSGGAYRMRSPNVLRLLGTRDDIEYKLLEVAERGEPPSLFAAGDTHRALDLASGVHSPLTETQIADVVGVGSNQLRVVVGTAATGVDALSAALEAVERDTATFALRPASKLSTFTRLLDTVPERSHHVVLDDVRAVGEDNLRKTLTLPASRLPVAPGATRSAVLVVDPEQLPVVESALGNDAAGVVVALGRFSPTALQTWALNVEGGFSDPTVTAEVMELTGGWPVLLDRLAVDGRARGAAAALAELRSELERFPQVLLEAAGLAETGLLSATFTQLVDLLGDGAEDPEAVVELLAVDGGVAADCALRAAVAAGVVSTSSDGKLEPERVVTAAWRRASKATEVVN